MNRHLSARSVAGIRLAALLLATASLAGCGILPKQETLALYRPEPTIAVDSAWPQADWQLQIARPYADTMHDSARILVRPQPGELQVYKGAAWTQPAPDLVLDTLLRAFADSGKLAGVARRGEGVSAQYQLLLDLRRFESDYSGGTTPGARIEIGARLVQNTSNRVVATRVFDVTVPAAGTDVVQVNRAFERALGDANMQLIGWVLAEGNRSVRER
ncbi:MAG: ABC transporter [Lysobacter sp.]|nr:ABC transporter [Lysobacter sp.]